MSKVWTDSELLAHVESAVESIKTYLHGLLSAATEKSKKRASLIGYWINDYVNYQQNEDSFNPRSMIHYKRGDIVQVHFGYRVGKEIGGLHFAVVIDVKNDLGSHLLTVAPLKSLKSTYKPSRYNFQLKTGLYELIKNKHQILYIKALEQVATSVNMTGKLVYNEIPLENVELRQKTLQEITLSTKISKKKIADLNSILETEKNLNKGSIIDMGQITTISKQRVSNPKIKSDSLYNIKLEPSDLDTVNKYLSDLYIYKCCE